MFNNFQQDCLARGVDPLDQDNVQDTKDLNHANVPDKTTIKFKSQYSIMNPLKTTEIGTAASQDMTPQLHQDV